MMIKHFSKTINSQKFLNNMLQEKQSIPEKTTVKIGSVVSFVDEDKNEYTFTLSSTDAKLSEGEISIHSPVGKALLGSKLGDRVKVTAPKGEYQVEILTLE